MAMGGWGPRRRGGPGQQLRAAVVLLHLLVGRQATVIEVFDECRAGGWPCAASLAEAALLAGVPGQCSHPCTIAFRGADETTGLPKALGPQAAANLHGTEGHPILITTAVAARAQVLAGGGSEPLITLHNSSWVAISDLVLRQNGRPCNASGACADNPCASCPGSTHITFSETKPAPPALSAVGEPNRRAGSRGPKESLLAAKLGRLRFRHNGTVRATDQFVLADAACGYLECMNCTQPWYSWGNHQMCPNWYVAVPSDGQTRPFTPAPGLSVPPLGLRSAPPLGGLGAGSVELRADGTLREWTITNQHPAGATKVQLMDDTVLGMAFGGTQSNKITKAIRVHPPPSLGAAAAVDALVFSGAHPVTRLKVQDEALGMAKIRAELFAWSTFRSASMRDSARPAVAFSLVVHNDGAEPVDARFLMNLPLAIEPDQSRSFGLTADDTLRTIPAAQPVECLRKCVAAEGCAAWSLLDGASCVLYKTAGLNAYDNSSTSGVPGTWSFEAHKGGISCATHTRAGSKGPMFGDFSLCSESTTGFIAADNLSGVWSQFQRGNEAPSAPADSHVYGALVAGASVPAHGQTSIEISFSWYFPDRDYMGLSIGNHYSNLWPSSREAGREMVADLSGTVDDLLALHSPFFGSSLPAWLQDNLVNSLSHIRSAWWDKSGRWRQWEAYDCVSLACVLTCESRSNEIVALAGECRQRA